VRRRAQVLDEMGDEMGDEERVEMGDGMEMDEMGDRPGHGGKRSVVRRSSR
jgi:hypothetical protein